MITAHTLSQAARSLSICCASRRPLRTSRRLLPTMSAWKRVRMSAAGRQRSVASSVIPCAMACRVEGVADRRSQAALRTLPGFVQCNAEQPHGAVQQELVWSWGPAKERRRSTAMRAPAVL